MSPYWAVPYASFTSTVPPVVAAATGGGDERDGAAVALTAVGRCRIHPTSATHETYREIVASAMDQALILSIPPPQQPDGERTSNSPDEEEEAAVNRKKMAKKFMKQGQALATRLLEHELQLDVSIVDVECYVDAGDLIATDGRLAACLLDAGCCKIVTCGTAVAALDAAQIPAHRLVAHFVYQTGHELQLQQAILQASEFCTTVSIELCHSDDISESVMMGILQNCCGNISPTTTITAGTTDESGNAGGASSNSSSHHHHHHPHPHSSATSPSTTTGNSGSSALLSSLQVVFVFNPKDCLGLLDPDLATLVNDVCRRADNNNRARIALINPTPEQLGLSFAKCLKTDRPDGLYTTVVVTRNGEALGLVYSSMASLVASLQCGRGVYYSRSRHGLWRKGDTSGHYQTLHRIDVDCDGDALRFCVTQRGGEDNVVAFCHLNTLTCWGEPKGLRHLEQALQHRLRHAPPGSYTQRLFSDATLLRDKLVEEAQELAEATNAEHVAEELADLLYFAMTRAVQAGVSLDDAAAVLDKRAHKVTRRQGDSKAFRIAAGQAILEKQQKEQDLSK